MADLTKINLKGTEYDIADAAARANLATEYSTSNAYAIGDYCIYGGYLYKCKTAITTGEAFTASKWNLANVGDELTAKQNAITGGATTIATSNLTVNRALTSNSSGKVSVSSVTSTELGYLSGVTSAIQTQLNGKQASGNYKTTQTAVSDPTASTDTSTTFISNISQNANGVISVTKKTVPSSVGTLSTPRAIDGVDFNGSAAITHYGTTSTAAATAIKVVSCTGFSLVTGARIAVKFTVANTASNPQLNVNGTGGKAIYYRGSAISATYLALNRTYEFIYNGTQFELVGDIDTNTTYTFDGTYNTNTNKAATVSTVTSAINALTATVSGLGTGKTITALSETNGVISASASDISIAASQVSSGTLGVARGGTGASSFTANKVVVSGTSTTGALSTSSVSTTELGYLSGATSNIQAQINAITGGGTDHVRFITTNVGTQTLPYTTAVPTSSWLVNSNGNTIVPSVNDICISADGYIGTVTSVSGTADCGVKFTNKMKILDASVSGTTLSLAYV